MDNEIWTVDMVRNELNNVRKFLTDRENLKTLVKNTLNDTLFFSKDKLPLIDFLYFKCDMLLNKCKHISSTSDLDSWNSALKELIFMLMLTLYVKETKHINSIKGINYDKFIERNSDMINFLIDKNRKYGNAALNPVRFMSSTNKIEQIFVRIDDKLNRLINRQNDEDEDILLDLSGYFILLFVCYSIAR
jgi:hypothetical protein